MTSELHEWINIGDSIPTSLHHLIIRENILCKCCLNMNLLMEVCMQGRISLVKLFIEKCNLTKADILCSDVTYNNCNDALFYACTYQRENVITLLIDTYNLTRNDFLRTKYNNKLFSLLLLACEQNYINLVKIFIEKGKLTKHDIIYGIKGNTKYSNYCENALYIACTHEYIDIVKLLIDIYNIPKSDLFEAKHFGYIPLWHVLCDDNCIHTIKFLLDIYNITKNDILSYISNYANRFLSFIIYYKKYNQLIIFLLGRCLKEGLTKTELKKNRILYFICFYNNYTLLRYIMQSFAKTNDPITKKDFMVQIQIPRKTLYGLLNKKNHCYLHKKFLINDMNVIIRDIETSF